MTASKWASDFRAGVNQLLNARSALKALREQDGAVALANAGTGIAGSIQASDLAGTNTDLNAQAFLDAEAAMDALEAILTDFGTTPPTPKPALQALLKLRS